jgi:hypothetical protein
MESQNLLSVTSNSTVSSLTFDSENKTFSFNVSGEDGTTGYIDFFISKTLISDITGLTVHLDGEEVPYTVQSQGDSWLVAFTYHHSSHQVDIELVSATAAETGFSGYWLIAALLAPLAIAIAVVMLIFRKKKTETR